MAIISSLEYSDIRTSIVSFLKQDPYFKAFNFEASNISRIINALAYSSMYQGYYTKMLMDESIADSAKTKNALIGHANTRNYLTKFISASKAMVNVKVDATNINTNNVPYIQILRGQQFKGVDGSNSVIYFLLPYDVTLHYDSTQNAYVGDDFLLIQGQQRTTSYTVNTLYSKYQISDVDCDESTISVKLKTNKDSLTKTEYVRRNDFYKSQGDDSSATCYYVTASSSGIYQIHFGHDIFGREPKVGEYIEITYIKTNGKSANDANSFKLVLNQSSTSDTTNINSYSSSQITTNSIEASTGGLDGESADELRYNLLNFSKVRSRVVTSDDIKSVILANFRDVESINVWSGGNSTYRQYGKTYISIKPKTSEYLSNTAKSIISDMLVNNYGVMNKTDLIFVNPNFTDILLTIRYKVNTSITSDNTSTISSNIVSTVNDFNNNTLSRFDVNYYDSDLITYIKSNLATVSSLFTEKLLQKRLELNYSYGKYTISFANAVKSITSSIFKYGTINAILTSDSSGNVFIYNNDTNTQIVNIGTINLVTGVCVINLPQYVSTSILDVIATPVYPDVNTQEDNIVRIKTTTAIEVK